MKDIQTLLEEERRVRPGLLNRGKRKKRRMRRRDRRKIPRCFSE
jgi:hypothetical protein